MKLQELLNLKRNDIKTVGNKTVGYAIKDNKRIKFSVDKARYNEAIKAKNIIIEQKNRMIKQKNELTLMNQKMNKILKINEKLTKKLTKTSTKYEKVNNTVFVNVECLIEVSTTKNKKFEESETHYFSFDSDIDLEQQVKTKLDSHYPFIDSWCTKFLKSYTYTIISMAKLAQIYKGDLKKVRMFSANAISYHNIKNGNTNSTVIIAYMMRSKKDII